MYNINPEAILVWIESEQDYILDILHEFEILGDTESKKVTYFRGKQLAFKAIVAYINSFKTKP